MPTVAKPLIMTNPGFLWIAPLGSTIPTNGGTVAGSKYTDALDAAWIPLGATAEGSSLSYTTEVEPIEVAEFFDPVGYETVSRAGSIAFALANFTLSNYRRAMNGGISALVAAAGTGATSAFVVEPPDPGQEVRAMIAWESTDSTVRLFLRQAIQGGEISSDFRKAPDYATIPCTYNMEIPAVGKPFTLYGSGVGRGGI